MNLIIVESPTKARTLSRFLGNEYQIEATMGHIRDLPKSKLGVDVEHDFTPEYLDLKDRKEMMTKLKATAKEASSVFLATDPDREGEAIAYHVSAVISPKTKSNPSTKLRVKKQEAKLNLKRIVFHEITESAIKEALAHAREIDMRLVDAQQARRVLDRLVGYKLSPLLWYKVRKGLSAGRVQSVTVRLIVEREREIEAFKPVEYWLVEAELAQQTTANSQPFDPAQGKQPATFLAKLSEKAGEKIEVTNKDQADQIVADLQKAPYRVATVEKKEMRRHPYPPFTTSTLQQAAANRYGWSAKKTMQIAQSLYEEGHITYHRTDSTTVAAEALTNVRAYIKNIFGDPYVPTSPKFYKTRSKVAQEAHEAIRPTSLDSSSKLNPATSSGLTSSSPSGFSVEGLSKFERVKAQSSILGRDAERLYDLIFKRFVACQMSEAVYDQTGVDVSAGVYTLRASGSVMKFPGWQAAYSGMQSEEPNQQESRLPELTVGEMLSLIKLLPQQKFTEPPPRYNEASLIKTLEEKGIGRPSTYAPTISTIIDRQYIEKTDRRLQPTPLGIAVNDFLVTNFPGIVDYDFTARMEDQLDSIASGELSWVPTIREFYEPFNKHLSTVYKASKRVKVATEATGENCPECGNPLVIRIGRFGKFIACSSYPKCKFTKQYIEKVGIPCPKCGGDTIMRRTKRGKVFYGCSNYPTCDFASWTKPKAEPGFAKPDAL